MTFLLFYGKILWYKSEATALAGGMKRGSVMYHVLYNPLSGNGRGYDAALVLRTELKDQEIAFSDIREVRSWKRLLEELPESDSLVIAGGDGTLQRFLQSTEGLVYPPRLFYFATGYENNFKRDTSLNGSCLIPLGSYLADLPFVTVKRTTRRFLNGIAFGLDSYCCAVGDLHRRESDDPVKYTWIAVKAVLLGYRPTRATVTVDGKVHRFRQVWLAPTLNGRFYGGGVMMAPEQDRLNSKGCLSVVVLHGTGLLKTLWLLPSLFKGTHLRHEDSITVLTGNDIRVAFNRPTVLQIDGETVRDVTEYHACRHHGTEQEENIKTNFVGGSMI